MWLQIWVLKCNTIIISSDIAVIIEYHYDTRFLLNLIHQSLCQLPFHQFSLCQSPYIVSVEIVRLDKVGT